MLLKIGMALYRRFWRNLQ